ncbi:MAG TPA: hypothetical protein VLS92_04295 [Acidimicrobiia bacterium]|nr:hypothetical protein [Acidimicrobiia bacterium]
MRRLGAILALTVLLAAACGDEADPFVTTQPDGTSSTEASTSVAPSTTAGTTTTEGVTTTTAATTTNAPAPGPSAADVLAAFVAAAEALDADIRAAAVLFNEGFDADAGTLDPGVAPVVDALDAVPLGLLIPAGLSLELETAVLAVFTDLDGRISALAGGVRGVDYPDMEFVLGCLTGGGPAATRFPDDLARARELAELEAAPAAAADSAEAGILAVRLTAVHSMNWGCDSCGGLEYDAPIEVDWAGQMVAGGVEFEAAFEEGAWQIIIHAC